MELKGEINISKIGSTYDRILYEYWNILSEFGND